jgi:hypothetical protein
VSNDIKINESIQPRKLHKASSVSEHRRYSLLHARPESYEIKTKIKQKIKENSEKM